MEIKRTELEILDMAIRIAAIKQKRECEIEFLEKNGILQQEIPKKPVMKKGDMATLEKHYLKVIEIEKANIKNEKEFENKSGLLREEVFQLSQQLDMLRWLYKEECE